MECWYNDSGGRFPPFHPSKIPRFHYSSFSQLLSSRLGGVLAFWMGFLEWIAHLGFVFFEGERPFVVIRHRLVLVADFRQIRQARLRVQVIEHRVNTGLFLSIW